MEYLTTEKILNSLKKLQKKDRDAIVSKFLLIDTIDDLNEFKKIFNVHENLMFENNISVFRIGDFRVFYTTVDQKILLLDVACRKGFED